MRRTLAPLVSSLALIALGAAAPAHAAVELTATADDYVSSAHPTAAYGSATLLKAAGSPVRRGYIRFSVPATQVSSATLRVWTLSSSSAAFQLRGAPDTWSESTLTYANSPAPSATVTASSGAASSGRWISLDATPLVKPLSGSGGRVSV